MNKGPHQHLMVMNAIHPPGYDGPLTHLSIHTDEMSTKQGCLWNSAPRIRRNLHVSTDAYVI